ncbi:MAG: hypothetical protein K8R02_05180 [Anaerohalosphaeraceae bacterium]|nr:hypothetical protein [Anaerohalosphaeraceae bacterium]
MTKNIPAAPAARLLYGAGGLLKFASTNPAIVMAGLNGSAKVINNLQVPLGQDPGANG